MPERRAARASLGEENGAAPNITSVTSAPPDPCVVGRSGSSEETVLEAFPLRSDRADPVLFLADPRLICLSGLVGIVRGLVPAGRKALRRSPSRFVRFISERTVHAGPGSSRAGKPSCGRPILPDDMDSVLRAPSDIAQLEGRFEPDSGDESSADPLGNGPAQKFAASRSVARSGSVTHSPPRSSKRTVWRRAPRESGSPWCGPRRAPISSVPLPVGTTPRVPQRPAIRVERGGRPDWGRTDFVPAGAFPSFRHEIASIASDHAFAPDRHSVDASVGTPRSVESIAPRNTAQC